MPSRRDLIRMTAEEADAYLRGQRRIILVTIGAQGMPHPVPMNYGVDPPGRIIMTAFAKSQKVRNLERDPRASLLVESGEDYAQLKSVMMETRVEIIREASVVAETMKLVQASEAMTASLDEGMSEQVRASIAKRVVLRFTPQRTISWDHGKLGQVY